MKQILLVKVSLVQWVIQSDVVVAQTGSNVVVWYNIDMPDHLNTFPVQGEIADIVREQVYAHCTIDSIYSSNRLFFDLIVFLSAGQNKNHYPGGFFGKHLLFG